MGRLRGYLWLVAGIVVAILAGAVAFVTLTRATAEDVGARSIMAPNESVVVAARTIDAQALLTAEDVEVKNVPVEALPEGVITDIDQVVGKITMVDLYPDEVLLSQRLIDPDIMAADGRTALVVSEGEVLMAFPAEDLMSQVDVLKPGDRVDFLFTHNLPADYDSDIFSRSAEETAVTIEDDENEDETEMVTFDLLQNITIAAIVGGDGEEDNRPDALLLTVSPQDALVLKYMKDAGAELDLVLRAPDDETRFSTDPVDVDYVINGYILSGEGGR